MRVRPTHLICGRDTFVQFDVFCYSKPLGVADLIASTMRIGLIGGQRMTQISTIEQLEAVYGSPKIASTVKVVDHVTPAYRMLIEKSPFAALVTCGPEGLITNRPKEKKRWWS